VKIFFTTLILTFVHNVICLAQFTDNFSDHDITTDPAWSGDDVNFSAVDGELRLSAPGVASTSYLSTTSEAINNATWLFNVQLDFNPSGTNLARIYLVSDQSNLTTSLNGYFVKVGNSNDDISLYRQDGTTEKIIIDGMDKELDLTNVKVKIKVTRDAAGNWKLYTDVGLTGNYFLEGSITDATHLQSSFFGVHCKYTSTRSNKFHFDDFEITGNPFADVVAPVLQHVTVLSSHDIELSFSELLNQASAENIIHYVADNNVGNPLTATLLPDQKTVRITYLTDFPNGITCILSTEGLTDLSGNMMAKTAMSFQFFQAQPVQWRDIIITEIYADPSPTIALPPIEYIELYNRSANPVNVQNWQLTDGNSASNFSSFILFPDEYIVVTSSNNTDQFAAYGKVIGLQNFPTLNNTGDALILKNNDGVVLDSISYSDTWYRDDDKKQGGWSLERIDINNLCAESENWMASEDDRGGTPGIQNSVYANKPDLTGPTMLNAIPLSSNTLLITFSEKLENTLPALSSFTFNPALEVKNLSFTDASLTAIKIELNGEIENETAYSIVVNDVHDCAGNALQPLSTPIDFGLPANADSLDVVINEILFNPRPTGVDFVEVYNRSSRYINLKNWSTANFKDGVVENVKVISTIDVLLKPLSYAALTSDGDILMGEYPRAHEERFIIANLPALNDDEGTIAVLTDSGKVIDNFSYSKSMHAFLITNDEGVSLERISCNEATNDIQNWRSANAQAGYATPGYMNSNQRPGIQLSDEAVQITPEVFIPATGNNDFAQINYSFDHGGYVANVKIYDTYGREIKQLATNTTLSAQGSFRWDGDRNNGSKANIGYYVVWFEVFDETGNVKTYRKRVVVGTRF
jgi:hypothetical protein